jgi:hypothetical protein
MIERTSIQIPQSGQRYDAPLEKASSPLFEIAHVVAHLDHVARVSINANDGVM